MVGNRKSDLFRILSRVASSRGITVVGFGLFVAYVIFAICGCLNLQVGISPIDFVPTASNSRKYLSDYRAFYGQTGADSYIELEFRGSVNYFHPQVRTAIEDMIAWVDGHSYAAKVVSWLKAFGKFEATSVYYVSQDTFVPVLRLVFLKDPMYNSFVSDIVVDEANEEIIKSKMFVELNPKGMKHLGVIVRTLQAKAAEANLPLVVKAPSRFALNHDVTIVPAFVGGVCIFIATVALITVGLLAQPLIAVLYAFVQGSVVVGTVGLCSFWDVPMNIFILNALFGMLVYSTSLFYSMAFHFMNNSFTSSRQRTAYAFMSCFGAATASTLIACLSCIPPLLISGNPASIQLLKFIIIGVGLSHLHTFIILPTALLLCGISLLECFGATDDMCNGSFNKCGGCSADETVSSVYFMPGGGGPRQPPAIDPNAIHRFYMAKFREDILMSEAQRQFTMDGGNIPRAIEGTQNGGASWANCSVEQGPRGFLHSPEHLADTSGKATLHGGYVQQEWAAEGHNKNRSEAHFISAFNYPDEKSIDDTQSVNGCGTQTTVPVSHVYQHDRRCDLRRSDQQQRNSEGAVKNTTSMATGNGSGRAATASSNSLRAPPPPPPHHSRHREHAASAKQRDRGQPDQREGFVGYECGDDRQYRTSRNGYTSDWGPEFTVSSTFSPVKLSHMARGGRISGTLVPTAQPPHCKHSSRGRRSSRPLGRRLSRDCSMY